MRLAAATVPPGGLVTSFLGNQVIYCSLICPLLVQTVATPSRDDADPGYIPHRTAIRQFIEGARHHRRIGDRAHERRRAAAILADGSISPQRALNAFEVAVVGLLNVVPAAAGGLPGLSPPWTPRARPFDALNSPIVANPTPTVTPHGVLQVAVVGLLNVGGAVIFPAFNEVLAGVGNPEAVAQELAATGDPARAVARGSTPRPRWGTRPCRSSPTQSSPRSTTSAQPPANPASAGTKIIADAEFRHDNNAGPRRGGTTSPFGHGDDRARHAELATPHTRCATSLRRPGRLHEAS